MAFACKDKMARAEPVCVGRNTCQTMLVRKRSMNFKELDMFVLPPNPKVRALVANNASLIALRLRFRASESQESG